jgi:aspartate/methionine/tyrosine aminotransferase
MGLKVYKEGVGLFVWANYQKEVYLQKSLLIRFSREVYFYSTGTIFGSNGEGYIRFALCVKEEKVQEQLIDFDSSQSCRGGRRCGCV